jgi:hypothetical protein
MSAPYTKQTNLQIRCPIPTLEKGRSNERPKVAVELEE